MFNSMFIGKKGVERYSAATHNVVFDGNSLIFGLGATTQYLANIVNTTGILLGKGLTVKSYGISNQTFQDLTANHTDVNAAYVNGARNILFVWEGTNSVWNGRSAVQTAADAQAYISSIKAINSGWEVYCILAIPRRQLRYNGESIAIANGVLDEFNQLIRLNYRNYGFSGYVDIRQAGSPFNFSGYTTSDFAAIDNLWATGEKSTDPYSIHLNSVGYNTVATYINDILLSI